VRESSTRAERFAVSPRLPNFSSVWLGTTERLGAGAAVFACAGAFEAVAGCVFVAGAVFVAVTAGVFVAGADFVTGADFVGGAVLVPSFFFVACAPNGAATARIVRAAMNRFT
jgi:hypothetical protein